MTDVHRQSCLELTRFQMSPVLSISQLVSKTSLVRYFLHSPAGTTRVVYEFHPKLKATGYSGISHYRFFIDSVEVVDRRTSRNWTYSGSNQGNAKQSFYLVIDCNASVLTPTMHRLLRGLHQSKLRCKPVSITVHIKCKPILTLGGMVVVHLARTPSIDQNL